MTKEEREELGLPLRQADPDSFKHEPADYEAVTVEQCDREAMRQACYITGWKGVADRLDRGWKPEAGTAEGDLLELLARHRTQANEAMREALERIRQISSKPTYPGNNLRDIDDIARNALSGDSA